MSAAMPTLRHIKETVHSPGVMREITEIDIKYRNEKEHRETPVRFFKKAQEGGIQAPFGNAPTPESNSTDSDIVVDRAYFFHVVLPKCTPGKTILKDTQRAGLGNGDRACPVHRQGVSLHGCAHVLCGTRCFSSEEPSLCHSITQSRSPHGARSHGIHVT